MATVPPPAPPPKPPPPKPSLPNGKASAPKRTFSVQTGVSQQAQRFVIYGPGGAGKSELASLITQVGFRPLFLDIGTGTQFMDVARIEGIATWDELRDVLHTESYFQGFDAIVIDDLTKAEELATAWVVQNIPHEKDKVIGSIEDYGWGKGFTHLYETFLLLLNDLDALRRAGKQIICIAHDCTSNVPNPNGEDYLRYEPRLQNPKSGQNSTRLRVKEWCDHLLFVGYDTAVNKEGKAKGAGTRTIYPTELPWLMAKTRLLTDPIPYQRGEGDLWKAIFKK